MEIADLKKYITDNGVECVPKILDGLGCENIKVNGNYITASNPDGDNAGAITCYLNESDVRVINWTRGYGNGDIISMVENIRGKGFVDAFKWIHNTLGLELKYKRPTEEKPIKENPFARLKRFKDGVRRFGEIGELDEAEIYRFSDIEWEGLYKEGVMPWTCKEFGIRYSYKWKRIIYPHRYALDGRLVAFNARTVIDEYEEFGIPKFHLTKGYLKSSNVYGLWENRKYIEKAGCCIVVESEKSVLKRHSLMDRRFCAVSGHTISEEQKRILIGIDVPEIVIAFDKDVSMYEVLSACDKLYKYKTVSFIRDSKDIMGPKDSIADLKDKDCRELINNRTKYTEFMHKKLAEKNGNK